MSSHVEAHSPGRSEAPLTMLPVPANLQATRMPWALPAASWEGLCGTCRHASQSLPESASAAGLAGQQGVCVKVVLVLVILS